MSKSSLHETKYRQFKADAERVENSLATRAEAYFLGAYHLIDACAGLKAVHIGKHQRVRQELERNPALFGGETEKVWQSFQNIENKLRPRFVYGDTGTEEDFRNLQLEFAALEVVCLPKLKS